MKEYMELSVTVFSDTAFEIYVERIFLPIETWKEIEDEFNYNVSLPYLFPDNKEFTSAIRTKIYDEEQLEKNYFSLRKDGDYLLKHIDSFLDTTKYDGYFLTNIQKQVEELRALEKVQYVIHKKDKEMMDYFAERMLSERWKKEEKLKKRGNRKDAENKRFFSFLRKND